MLFEPALGLGMESTDMRSAWLASFLRRVLLRLTIVDVSGFRCEPTSDAGAPETMLVSSEIAELATRERRVDFFLVLDDSSETIVDRRFPVDGNMRGPKS